MAWLIVGVAEIWGNGTLIIAYWIAFSELELGNIGRQTERGINRRGAIEEG